MSTQRTARVVLQYVLDRNSFDAALAAQGQLEQTTRRVEQEFSNLFTRTAVQGQTVEHVMQRLNMQFGDMARAQAIDRIPGIFAQVERKSKDTALALRVVAEELRKVGATDAEIARVGDSIGNIGGRGPGRALSRAGMALFNLPAVGPSTPIARVMVLLGNAADRTGASLGTMAGALGIAGAAVVALGIVLNQFSESTKEAKNLLAGALEGQNAYYEALGNLSESEVRERIADLQRIQALRAQQIAETSAALESAFAQAQARFSDPVARLLDNQLPTAQLREQLENLEKQSAAADSEITRLNQGLEQNAFAATSAAQAEKELQDQRKRSVEQFQLIVQREIQLQDMTAEQRYERALELQREYEVLVQFATANRDNADIMTYARERVEEVNMEMMQLVQITETVADREHALAVAREQISDQTDAYFDAITEEVEKREALNEAIADYNKSLAESQQRIAEILADAATKRAEAEASYQDALIDATKKRQASVEKAEEDHAIRVLEINKRANRDIANAIGNRDALAAYMAEQQRKDDLEKEATQHDQRLKQIEDAHKEQTEAIKKRLDEQLRNIQQNADRALNTERQRYANEEAIRRNAINRAQVDLYNAEQQLAAIRNTAMQGRLITEYNHYMTLDNIVTGFLNNMAFKFGYYFNMISGSFPTGGGGGGIPGVGGGALPTPLRSGLTQTQFDSMYDRSTLRYVSGTSNYR